MTNIRDDSTSSADNHTNNVKEKKEKSEGDQKPKSTEGGGKSKFDEAALENEFQAFVGKLKKQYGPNKLAYQISNHPEGVELSVRVAKKPVAAGLKRLDYFCRSL